MAKKGKTPLGFIGLGLMGLPMTLNLLKGGHPVTVWNRTREKILPALQAGAKEAASPAEVARAADIIHLCVFDGASVEEVVFGPDGVMEGAKPGKIVVDHTTTGPEATRDLALRLKREAGMGWVDAPVTGGVVGAKAGTLAIFAGGAEADVEKARPAMKHVARRFVRMGDVGAGQITKMCNQIVVGCTIPMLSEMFALARDNGVDVALLPDVLEGGFADSTILQLHGRRMIKHDFARQGQAKTLMKDLDLITAVAKGSGTPLPMTGLAAQLWRLFLLHGNANQDGIAIVTMYEKGARKPQVKPRPPVRVPIRPVPKPPARKKPTSR
jgi:3-hydroxyisobutyrate dehydrogenase